MAHTSGPWDVVNGEIWSHGISGAVRIGRIYHGFCDEPDPSKRAGNLLLMGAAPELLEACRRALIACENLKRAGALQSWAIANFQALRAAIAKAEHS
jgi:hypothetical protein